MTRAQLACLAGAPVVGERCIVRARNQRKQPCATSLGTVPALLLSARKWRVIGHGFAVTPRYRPRGSLRVQVYIFLRRRRRRWRLTTLGLGSRAATCVMRRDSDDLYAHDEPCSMDDGCCRSRRHLVHSPPTTQQAAMQQQPPTLMNPGGWKLTHCHVCPTTVGPMWQWLTAEETRP